MQLHHFNAKPAFSVIGIIMAVAGFVLIARYAARLSILAVGKRPYEQITDMVEYAALMRLGAYGIQFLAVFTFSRWFRKTKCSTAVGRTTMVVYLLHMAVVRWFHEDPFKQYLLETSHLDIVCHELVDRLFLVPETGRSIFQSPSVEKTSLNFNLWTWAGKCFPKNNGGTMEPFKRGIGKEPGSFDRALEAGLFVHPSLTWMCIVLCIFMYD